MPWSKAFKNDAEEYKFYDLAEAELIKKGELSANRDNDRGKIFSDGTSERNRVVLYRAIEMKKRCR